ncbi:secretin N-terminal domain-containing protein [Marinobacter sp. S0848L]|uniref:secretin N-terminal domain-containing protein n=1 Tax=Marinobacter sp. S0848L TaxID=2926423 RepID=UPI001FF2EBAA|nr:secretin N-terminal domain-containing protein [Marinobacter sp. S0848L]MCK0105222.1 secretin [Marinobacter sp. S0848L]
MNIEKPSWFARFTTLGMVCLLALSVVTTHVQAEPEARIYQLKNRTADDVSQQIRALYQQAPVSVTARGLQLVVRGEPELLDEIGTLVNTLDVPPVQMRISVRYLQDIGGKQSGAGVSITNNKANARVQSRTYSTNSNRVRQLVVQDGQSAHITSGNVRSLPFAVQGGRNPAMILERVETRSGFVVSPQAISDQAIELNIVSFEEDPAALEGYETEALMTIRRVQPGQWVDLGGTRTEDTHQRDGILYRANGKQADNQSIEVKVEVLP